MTIGFHKDEEFRFATGITNRVCNSADQAMAASTFLWRLADQDAPALIEAKAMMEAGRRIQSEKLIDWLVTEYPPESRLVGFLAGKLEGLIAAPMLGPYGDMFKDEEAAHEFDHLVIDHRNMMRERSKEAASARSPSVAATDHHDV